jgi:cyclase
MKTVRAHALFALGVALVAARPASAAPGPYDYEMTTVAPGVYAFVEKQLGWSVSGTITAVVGDDGVLLFDAGHHESITTGILADLKRVTDKPVRYVVISHWHDDHWVALPAIAKAYPRAQVIAHEFTARMMATRKDGIRGEGCKTEILAGTQEMRDRLAKGTLDNGSPIPDRAKERLTFHLASADGQLAECETNGWRDIDRRMTDRMTIDLGHRRVELRHLGRANTAGDVVAYVPDAKTLLAGDVIVYPWPFATESYITEWAKVLRSIEQMDVSATVPGHGAVQRDKSYVRMLAELFESIATQARVAYRDGMTADELRAKIDVAQFRERFAHGDAFIGGNFDAQMQSAVGRMWEELSGKWKPEGD